MTEEMPNVFYYHLFSLLFFSIFLCLKIRHLIFPLCRYVAAYFHAEEIGDLPDVALAKGQILLFIFFINNIAYNRQILFLLNLYVTFFFLCLVKLEGTIPAYYLFSVCRFCLAFC